MLEKEEQMKCKCDEIMAKDPTRHFRGCPKRDEHPRHPAEIEKQTIQALENMGVDTKCGACMGIAFTGVTTHEHTCHRSQSDFQVSVVSIPSMPTFEEAWAEKVAVGYQYGEDALQGVHFGWEIAMDWMKRTGRIG